METYVEERGETRLIRRVRDRDGVDLRRLRYTRLKVQLELQQRKVDNKVALVIVPESG